MGVIETTLKEEDVTILLDGMDISVPDIKNHITEVEIYNENLLRYMSVQRYIDMYNNITENEYIILVILVQALAERVLLERGEDIILISLNTTSIITGILLKRYIKIKYSIDLKHYMISNLYTRGIDRKALDTLVDTYGTLNLVFIDSYTKSRGMFAKFQKNIIKLKALDTKYEYLTKDIYILSDPFNVTDMSVSKYDFFIPHACLGSLLTGMISDACIIKYDRYYSGISYLKDKERDLTYNYINKVTEKFSKHTNYDIEYQYLILNKTRHEGMSEQAIISEEFNIHDVTKIKAGINETVRTLLICKPKYVLISSFDFDNQVILFLCEKLNIEPINYPLQLFRAVAIVE